MKITAGSTSYTLPIFVSNAASTSGSGLSGLVHNTAGLVSEYRREGQANWVTINRQAGTLGTWSDGGFVADGSLAGGYELGLPNACIAAETGVRWVIVRLYGAANMVPVLQRIELDRIPYNVELGTSGAIARVADIPTTGSMADAILVRDWTQITGTVPSRSTLNALRFLRNKWEVSAGTLSVKREDDTTEAWNGTVTSDTNGINAVDPS